MDVLLHSAMRRIAIPSVFLLNVAMVNVSMKSVFALASRPR